MPHRGRRVGLRRIASWGLAAALGLALACVVAGIGWVGQSDADTTTTATTQGCPPQPPAYSGTDTQIAAIVNAQADADQSCSALTTALQSAATTDAPQKTVTVAQSAPLTVTQTGTATAPATQTGTVAVSNFPTTQTVQDDNYTLSSSDADFEGIHEDIWLLSGIVVGAFVFYVFIRKVWP